MIIIPVAIKRPVVILLPPGGMLVNSRVVPWPCIKFIDTQLYTMPLERGTVGARCLAQERGASGQGSNT